MTLTVTHQFVSGIADDPAHPELVQPGDWNDKHTMLATDGVLLGASGSTTVTEITVGSGLSLAAGVLTATGGGGAIGTDTQIPFNDAGTMAGDANLTWDKSTQSLLVNGSIVGLGATAAGFVGGQVNFQIDPATADSEAGEADGGRWALNNGDATDGVNTSPGLIWSTDAATIDASSMQGGGISITQAAMSNGTSQVGNATLQLTQSQIALDNSSAYAGEWDFNVGGASDGVDSANEFQFLIIGGFVDGGPTDGHVEWGRAGNRLTGIANSGHIVAPRPSKFVDADYTTKATDWTLVVDTTLGNVTITLANQEEGQVYNIKRVTGGIETLTVDGNGTNIDASGTKSLPLQYDSLTIQYDANIGVWNVL